MFIEYVKGEKYPSNNADTSDNLDCFEDAGYLLGNNDLVIDIDNLDKEIIKKVIAEFGIKTHTVWTDRGAHLYFEKPRHFKSGKRVCALGFECEYKTIKSNRSVCVKRNGVARLVENVGIRQELPEVFKLVRHFKELYGLSVGDGRNNALRDHRIKLADCHGFQHIISFINKHIFAEPLSDKELNNTILRADFNVNTGKTEYEIADYIINKHRVKRVNNDIYFYDVNCFITSEIKLKQLIFEVVGSVKTKIIDEVYKQIQYRAPIQELRNLPIKFKNGVLKDGEFYNVDYKEFTTYYIDIDYKENAKPVKEVDEYIEQMTEQDESYADYVFEILAHCFITDQEFKRGLGKFFVFVGRGGNGKGTLLSLIKTILGYNNCSALSIKQMSDERYFSSMLNKLANLGDDIEDEPIDKKDMKMLKNVSTCDTVELRKLFKNSEASIITASLIFTSNHVLKSFEKGDSYKRRVVWCPMYTKPKKVDPLFIRKLTTPEALEYWISQIIKAYKRLYNEGFTYCEKLDKWNKEYHEQNDGAGTFLDGYEKEDLENQKPTDVYNQFEIWCTENDFMPSRKVLYNAIESKFGLTPKVVKVNKQPVRVFKPLKD